MKNKEAFSLARLEAHVHGRRYDMAAVELLKLLELLNNKNGFWNKIGITPSNIHTHDRDDLLVITRTVAAISSLFASPQFVLNKPLWSRYIFFQRWMTILFGASGFGNADHVIQLMSARFSRDGKFFLHDHLLTKFSLLYFGDSNLPLQAEAIWNRDQTVATGMFMAILTSRLVITKPAMLKKEFLLEWLPEKLQENKLEDGMLSYLHDVMMHSSYAFTPKKHRIKNILNKLLRNRLLEAGCKEFDAVNSLGAKEKPVIVIPLEWFTSRHAMYRCYTPVIQSLKNRFKIIAIALPGTIDAVSREIFDEVYELANRPVLIQIHEAIEEINKIKPDIIYYPSVGMQLMVIGLASMRLAPLQIMSAGHPASSYSDNIDFFVMRKSTVSNPDRMAERIFCVPDDSMPFIKPHDTKYVEPDIRSAPDIIRIAVTASVMKINHVFLTTCQNISNQSTRHVEFHFFVGHSVGVTHHYVKNHIENMLSNAVIYPTTNYDKYISNLNNCDLFLSPFPFGNTNGIVDAVRQGIPGVCLNGEELHSHIDAVMFDRLKLPKWLTTQNIEEYVVSAVKLIDKHHLRKEISNQLIKTDPDSILYDGDTTKFCDAIHWLYQDQNNINETLKIVIPERSSLLVEHQESSSSLK